MKKALKGIFYSLLSLVGLVVILVVFQWATSCGACLQDQDYEFMNRVKTNLDKVGDTVKVSDIHPGEWQKVCIAYGTSYHNDRSWVPNPDGKGRKKRIILNDANPILATGSALLFHYGKNYKNQEQVEMFKMTSDQMKFQGPSVDYDCVPRNHAYLEVKFNEKYREKPQDVVVRATDFMHIKLITKEEDE